MKENLVIYSKCDGLKLGVTIFEPKGKCKGIVQISHGMSEHKDRYYEFMQFLADNGYVSVIHDHRGHGESVKDKTDLGYFYTKNIDFIDNEPIINIKYKSLGALREISDIKNLGDPQVIKNIEKETENAVKTLMQKGINATQNIFKSDIFGFGNMIYKKNPDYFLNITDWDNGYFPNLKINIDVDVELKTKGSLEQTLGGITYEFNY